MSSRIYRPGLLLALAIAQLAVLAGCGQMGPLVQRSSLEDANETSNAETGVDEEEDEQESDEDER